jgi:hypothetical protein
LIYVRFESPGFVDWQDEIGYDAWNVYAGDLDVLRADGLYTQEPGSNPLATALCGLPSSSAATPIFVSPGQTAFFLATGVAAGVEGSLGQDSAGNERPNANPCPP